MKDIEQFTNQLAYFQNRRKDGTTTRFLLFVKLLEGPMTHEEFTQYGNFTNSKVAVWSTRRAVALGLINKEKKWLKAAPKNVEISLTPYGRRLVNHLVKFYQDEIGN